MMTSVSAWSFLAARSTSIPSAPCIFRSVRTMSKRFCSSLSIPEEPESAVFTSHPSVRKRSSRKVRTWSSSSTIRILLCDGIFTGYFLLTAHRIAAPPATRMSTRDATSSRANRERRDRHEGEEQEKQGECDPSRSSPARGGNSFHRVSYTTNRSGPEQEAHRFPARPEGSARYPCLLTTTAPHVGQTVSSAPSRG